MTKKIKDLTKKELNCICKQNLYCSKCPLEISKDNNILCIKSVLEHLKEFNAILEEEIEVDDAKED